MVGAGGLYIISDVVTDKIKKARHDISYIGKKIGCVCYFIVIGSIFMEIILISLD